MRTWGKKMLFRNGHDDGWIAAFNMAVGWALLRR